MRVGTRWGSMQQIGWLLKSQAAERRRCRPSIPLMLYLTKMTHCRPSHPIGDPRLGQHHRIVQLGHDHSHQPPDRSTPPERPSSVKVSGLSKAIRSPQHNDENGPPSIARAQSRNTSASKSGSITGMVIAICTTAILACRPLNADGCRRGSMTGWESPPTLSRTCGSLSPISSDHDSSTRASSGGPFLSRSPTTPTRRLATRSHSCSAVSSTTWAAR